MGFPLEWGSQSRSQSQSQSQSQCLLFSPPSRVFSTSSTGGVMAGAARWCISAGHPEGSSAAAACATGLRLPADSGRQEMLGSAASC